jgi:membrane associated rhomboid family serine protease
MTSNMNSQMRAQIPPISFTLKILIGITVAVWLVAQVVLEGYMDVAITKHLALYPGKVILDGAVWQLLTYMFLHSMNFTHLLFNMLMLWFIGSELEARWGPRFFVTYYLLSGVGAAIIYTLCVGIFSSYTGRQQGLVIPVVGASGGIFGLLLAYGLLFGERIIHFMMIFPMKAKVFVLILGGVEAMSLVSSGLSGGETANLAHLGGLVAGFLILQAQRQIQKYQWNKKAKAKGRYLRLVVDNEKKPDKSPKYWN